MYGSSTMRAYYGAGDYQRALVQAQGAGYAGGYYAAGGFFSSLKKAASKAVSGVMGANLAKFSPIAKLAGGIGGKLLKGVPVLGTALTAFDIGKDLYKSYAGGSGGGIAKSIGKLATMKPGLASGAGAAVGLGAARAVEKRSRKRRRTTRAAPPRRSSSRSRSPRRSRSRYSRGDWGDDGGRDKRGHYLNEVGGHRHFRRRRRSRGRGGRVSFTTKDGRRVSFTARGDA